jgi:hypothetical protein
MEVLVHFSPSSTEKVYYFIGFAYQGNKDIVCRFIAEYIVA